MPLHKRPEKVESIPSLQAVVSQYIELVGQLREKNPAEPVFISPSNKMYLQNFGLFFSEYIPSHNSNLSETVRESIRNWIKIQPSGVGIGNPVNGVNVILIKTSEQDYLWRTIPAGSTHEEERRMFHLFVVQQVIADLFSSNSQGSGTISVLTDAQVIEHVAYLMSMVTRLPVVR